MTAVLRNSVKSIFIAAFACSMMFLSDLVSAAEPASNNQKKWIATLERWYATRDYKMLAEKLDWRHAPGFFGGEVLTSPAQVENQLMPFYSMVFDKIEVEIDRIEAGQESVFSVGTYLLTPKNSSIVYRAPFVHIWKVDRDGRLVELVQVADTQVISQALAGARVLKDAQPK